MAILKVVHYPNPVLEEVAQPVEVVSEDIKTLVDDMFETMYDDRGCGLAANQVGIAKRIIVMDSTYDKSERICLINPEIIEQDGSIEMDEGCLSFPGLYLPVKRSEKVKVKALDRNGEVIEINADGLLARIILHEYDHIQGITFLDYLSPLKRKRAIKKLDKVRRRRL